MYSGIIASTDGDTTLIWGGILSKITNLIYLLDYSTIYAAVLNKINPSLKIIKETLPADDPLQRRPLIDLAKSELNWTPKTSLDEGLDLTISYFKELLKCN